VLVNYLAPYKLKALWDEVAAAAVYCDDIDLDATCMIAGYDICPMKEVGRYMDVYASLHTVMCAVACLKSVVSGHEVVANKNQVKDWIKEAFKQASKACGTVRNMVDGLDVRPGPGFAAVELERVLKQMLAWVAAAVSCLPAIGADILVQMVDDAQALVASVKTHTPEWEHVVTEETYAKTLAKRVIIDAQFADLLSDEVGALFATIHELSLMAGAWDCKSLLEKEEAWNAGMANASGAYTKAKKFLTIRACCMTVQVKTGTAQIDQAKLLLKKRETLPGAMGRALDSCIHQRGGAGSGFGAAKRKADDAVDVGDVSTAIVPAAPLGNRRAVAKARSIAPVRASRRSASK